MEKGRKRRTDGPVLNAGITNKAPTERDVDIRPKSDDDKAMEKEPLTMSIPEFARITGVSKGLAYSLARRDELPVPVIFLGSHRMLLSRSSVMTLLIERKSTKSGG